MDDRCQKFTSEEIANEMLDMLGYKNRLYGKKILENSCGEGHILCIVVERYIKDAIKQGYLSDQIVRGLESDIYAFEIMESTYDICIRNLNHVAAKYHLFDIAWKVYNKDVLKYNFKMTFDYIVGNPPYISYTNLDKKTREFLKNKYSTCKKGKPDYCYAFIENAVHNLNNQGAMVYLIPNSIFKNVFAKDLRDFMLPYIAEIRDYPSKNLFKDALTSSAIMKLKKNQYIKRVKYINIPKNETFFVQKNQLGEKWIFHNKALFHHEEKMSFGTYFRASITIATQRNQIYVIDEKKKNQYQIERGVLRKAISPRNQNYQNKEYIIFPYMIRKNKVISYSEEDFREKYPNVYAYLTENKEELEKRDADKAAQWFEYGRSQALQYMNMSKLLISTVITDKIKVYELSNRQVPYSGIYIVSENGYDISLAKQILESKQFLKHVKRIGTPASGSSLRITADDVNRFVFEVGDFVD